MVRSSFPSRIFFWLACAVVCLLPAGWLAPAAAQTPTAEQIEIFQGLPQDQQQQILEQMNRGGTQGTGTGTRPRTDRRLNFPETVQPRDRRARDGDDEDQEELLPNGMPREPRLKANDTVLLSLEVRQLERAAPEVEERERRDREQSKAGQQPQVPSQPTIPGRQQSPDGADAGREPRAAPHKALGRRSRSPRRFPRAGAAP